MKAEPAIYARPARRAAPATMQPALAAIVLVAGFALAFYWVLFDADEGFCLLVVGLAGLAAAFYRTEPAGRRLDRRLRELREGRA